MELLLTPAELLEQARSLRTKVLNNAHRIPKAKAIANWLGNIETTIIEDQAKSEKEPDKNQIKIDVDKDLASTGHGRKAQAA